MTLSRVRACSRLASREIKRGAAAAGRSNTLRFTTMMVSMVGAGDWPDRWTGGPAVRTATAAAIASLLEQINALVQRVGHVASGVVPFRKIQGRVHATRDLPQPARRERERAADRVRLQRATQTRHGRVGQDARGRGTKHVWDVLSQVPHGFQIQGEGERVLVSFADGGVKVVSRHAQALAGVRRVDRHPKRRERGVRLPDQAAVAYPAGAALEAQGVVGAGYTIAGEADERQQRRAKTSRDGVAQKRRAEA